MLKCSAVFLVALSSLFFIQCQSANFYEGDICSDENGTNGDCKKIGDCSWALSQIRKMLHVKLCSFSGKTPIVCCPNNEGFFTNTRPTQNSPIREKPRQKPYGEISSKKCNEYYPLDINFAFGGVPSLAQEFPHMAALGYGTKEDIQWLCGGSLISRKHILTAAHCLASREYGNVKFVRLGDLDLKKTSDVDVEPQDFTVVQAIGHPEYQAREAKHDIAVLELNKEIVWNLFVKPACLHVGNSWEDWWPLTATGWGITEFTGEPSSHLIKVSLKIVENAECRRKYAKEGTRGRIDDKSQICADSSDPSKIQDTCQGDSGGPLQVANFTKEKHYSIIGVTSFGKACGITSSPGIYTRVSFYVPWIESIVWGS